MNITLKSIKQNGGATIDRNGYAKNYNKGFQVSIHDLQIIPIYKLRKKELEKIVNSLKSGQYLGVWIDAGKVYIDISVRKYNRENAVKLGRELEQISIFDWNTKECIYC